MVFTERSRNSRQAILKAARSEFAAVGFDRATIRSIAAAAESDPALVMRYYGSKDGLFAAAVDVDLALPPAGPYSDLGQLLSRHFVSLWEGPQSDGTLQMLLRSAGGSPQVAERVRIVFGAQVASWVAAVAPGTSSRLAGRIATYVLGTALSRYVLALPPLATLTGDELADELGAVLQLLFDQHAAHG